MPSQLGQAVPSLALVDPVTGEGADTDQESGGDAPPLGTPVPHVGTPWSSPQPRPLHHGPCGATNTCSPICAAEALSVEDG
eukprot:2349091-Pyramimonas_sp.AAC.1